MELGARIKKTFFMQFEGNFFSYYMYFQSYQKGPICGAGQKPENELDETKLTRFSSRLINFYL